MKKSSFLISLILHIILLTIRWEFDFKNNDNVVEKKEKKIKVISVVLKSLKDKDIIELDSYNNIIDPEAKFISSENNLSKNKNKEKSILTNEDKITLLNNGLNSSKNKKNTNGKDKNKKNTNGKDKNKNDASTLKFAYFNSYYKKMKNIVDPKWEEIIRKRELKIIDNSIETYVLLKISSDGIILDKKIDKSSGIIGVDFAALDTFKNIKLPIPPKELLRNKDFLFIQWGFSLKVLN